MAEFQNILFKDASSIATDITEVAERNKDIIKLIKNMQISQMK